MSTHPDESNMARSVEEPHSKKVEQGSAQPAQRSAKRMGTGRRILRWAGRGVLGLVLFVSASAGASYVFLRTDTGERWLTSVINQSLQALPSGLSGSIESFSGPLLSEARLHGLVLRDSRGEWLTAKQAVLRIDWGALPSAFVISELAADAPSLLRLPELEASPQQEEPVPASSATPQDMLDALSAFLKDWPSWLPQLRIDSLALRSLKVEKDVASLPFTASLDASASAGPQGIKTGLDIRREDSPLPADAFNRHAALSASLSPALELMLDARLSDLGFASAFLPPAAAKVPALGLTVQGKAPIADWKADIDGAFRDLAVAGGDELLSMKGGLALAALSDAPEAALKFDALSGPLAHRLWALAGQPGGRVSLGVDAKAKAGRTLDASTAIQLSLADMKWASAELSALLGKDVTLQSAASIRRGAEGRLDAKLEKLAAKAQHLRAEAVGGVVIGAEGLQHPSSHAEATVRASLLDAAELSPELSGDVDLQAQVKGAFNALAADLGLRGSRLTLPGLTLKDMDVSVSMPSIDVVRLASASRAEKNAAPLLTGAARANLSANDQPVSLLADWQASNAAKGLMLSLSRLDLNAGGNAIQGQMSALLPAGAPAPAKGTVAHLAGAVLPALNGRLDLDVTNWETLSALSGMKLSGAPLSADIHMENSGKQAFRLTSDIPSVLFAQDGRQTSLDKGRIDVTASDLWGRPLAELSAGLEGLTMDGVTVGPVSLSASGGLDAMRVAAQSAGAVDADVKAEWQPGRILLEKLDVSTQPGLFGYPDAQPFGIVLAKAAEITWSGSTFSSTDISGTLLPSGDFALSGSFSPEKMKGAIKLDALKLEHFRPVAPALAGGEASLLADVSGSPHAPLANFKFNLKDVLISGSSLPAIDLLLDGDLGMHGKKRLLQAKLDMPEETQKALGLTRFALKGALPFTSPGKGSIAQPDLKAPMDAVLSLAGRLEGLWKLVPSADMRLSGLADVDVHVEGTASAPVITAHASVDKGRFSDIMNGVGLRDIQLKADANKLDIVHKKAADRVTLSLSARAGSKGTLEMGGWLDPAAMALNIDGTMKSLAPLRRQDAKVMLSGTFGVQGTVTSPVVTADITVEKGEVQLANLPGSSIPTLEIWTPEQAAKEKEATAETGRLDVKVTIPNQFFVRGYGLDCEWGGQLLIDAPLNAPAVGGELKAVRGTLDILGKNFKLANGQIRFDGSWPVMPLINIDMEYEASSLTANILVTGTASKPKLTLTSKPALPQDEILSRIMFGQSANSLSHVQALQLAAGAASLVGFGGPGVMDMGRKLLGVDVFKINSDNDGEDSDVSNTSLEMGTYVRDNIYVGLDQGIGKNSDTGAVVEIELRPGLEAQARASGSDTEVGLEWKKNY